MSFHSMAGGIAASGRCLENHPSLEERRESGVSAVDVRMFEAARNSPLTSNVSANPMARRINTCLSISTLALAWELGVNGWRGGVDLLMHTSMPLP
jgi:hypothetical protein